MNQSLLADMIVAVHFEYVAIVVFGLFAILAGRVLRWRFIRNFWFRITHLAMILIVVVESLFGIACPMTVWEYELRAAAGQQDTAAMSFVARLIHHLIFYEFPSSVFTVGYCLFATAVLASWWLVPPILPWKHGARPESVKRDSH
ncbi:MAG: DUF2784 domain-containing protein [Spirochaetaceae bacterium]|nr:DUF2784 domain-containing protein [Spirochaetaceae bacterium]